MQDSEHVCAMLYDLARTHNGESVFVNLSGVDVLIIQSPADADHVLRLNARNYDKNMVWFRRTLGASRFSENGDAWELRRQLTQPAYNRFDREAAFAIATTCANATIDAMAARSAAGVETIDDDALRDLTADILLRSFFDHSLADSGVDMAALADAMTFASEYSFVPEGETSRQFRERLPQLLISRKRVLEMLRFFRSAALDGQPLIERLRAADADKASGVVLEYEMITFLAAGSETSAATLGWMCYLLARHPDLQDELRTEALAFWNGDDPAAGATGAADELAAHDGGGACPFHHDTEHSDADISAREAVSWARLSQRQRLFRFVGEALRLYPVTPLIARIALGDDVIGPHAIKPGQNVLVSFIGVNHARTLRPEPWSIDLDDRLDRLAYGDQTSFSLGPRVCGGKQFAMLEIVAIMATFLRRARFTLTSDAPPVFRWKGQMLRAGGHPVRVELL